MRKVRATKGEAGAFVMGFMCAKLTDAKGGVNAARHSGSSFGPKGPLPDPRACRIVAQS
jgi:hypothetical protein